MAGMMSSNISDMTISWKKLLRKKLAIRFKSLLRSLKIKIGGRPFVTNSTWRISTSLISNSKSSTESEAEKWPPKPSPPPTTHTSSTTTTPCHSTRIPPANATSCPPSGNKWKSTKFLMDCSVAGSSGTKTTKIKSNKRNSCMTHGPVAPLRKEVSLTLPRWRPNCRGIVSLTTRRRNFYWVRRKKKSGRSCMKKTSRSILFLRLSTRWGTFRFTTGWFRSDSRGVWTCTCARE